MKYFKIWCALFGVCLWILVGCVRPFTTFEERISLTRHQADRWTLTWSTIARRGIETVSNGHVGTANISWDCRPHPSESLTWILEPNEVRRKASDAAEHVFAKHTTKQWSGTVTFNAAEKMMVINIIDSDKKPFVGKRQYINANGNGETYVGQ